MVGLLRSGGFGGLVLPPNVDPFPGPTGPSFQVSTEPGQDQGKRVTMLVNDSTYGDSTEMGWQEIAKRVLAAEADRGAGASLPSTVHAVRNAT